MPLGRAYSPAQPDCLLAPPGSAPVHRGLEVVLGIKSRALCVLEKALFLNLHPSLLAFLYVLVRLGKVKEQVLVTQHDRSPHSGDPHQPPGLSLAGYTASLHPHHALPRAILISWLECVAEQYWLRHCSLSVQLMPLLKLQHPNISLYHEMFIMWNNEVSWSTHSPEADSMEHSERQAFPVSCASSLMIPQQPQHMKPNSPFHKGGC